MGYFLNIPAGAMLTAALGVACFNVRTDKAYMPDCFRIAAQCCAGAAIGVGITLSDVLTARTLIPPLLVVIANTVAVNYILGLAIYKVSGLDIGTCLFGSIPAGISDMALISTEMGGDAPKVAVLHLVRYIGLMSIMPGLIQIIVRYWPA